MDSRYARGSLFFSTVLSLVCLGNCKSLFGTRGALIGLAYSDTGKYLNLVKVDPQTLSTSMMEVNISLYAPNGVSPQFSTAYCPNSGLFMIAINGNFAPRVVAVNLKAGYKVLGAFNLRGFYIDNLECDSKTGFGLAYVFLNSIDHQLIQLDFSTFSAKVLMTTPYKSYGGSAVDSSSGKMYLVTVLPKFDSYKFSINTLEYRTGKDFLSTVFPGCSIGGMVFDSQLDQPIAVLQTPPQFNKTLEYRAVLASLDVGKGTVKPLVESWPGQLAVSNTGVTLDPISRIAYVFSEEYIRAFNLDKGTILYSKSTKSFPQPVINYKWVE